jgi:hypothetical protein
MKREIIDGLMPGFLALIGFVVAVVSLIIPNLSDSTRAEALNVATVTIAGAAGLAQPEKRDKKEPNE